MKSLKVKIDDVAKAFRLLNDAKYQKLSDDDKVKVWRITRTLKPIAMKFEEDIQDARVRLAPSEDFNSKLMKALEYEKLKAEGKEELPMSEEQYKSILGEYNKFRDLMNKALDDYANQVMEIEIDTLSEEAFGKLMASNDWTFKQVSDLEIMIEN